MGKQKRTTREKVLLGFSLGGATGVSPFAIYRILEQQWLIGLVDLFAAIGMFSLFFYVHKTHKIELASIILSIITLLAVVFSIHIKGSAQAYWIFPVTVSFFYLLKPKLSLVFTVITIILILPVLLKENHSLTNGLLIVPLLITISLAFIFSKEMNQQRLLLLEQTTKDPLTGIGNRRALTEKLEQLIALFQRTEHKVSLLLIDVDYFKVINDTYGHNAGDNCLIKIAALFKSRIRVSDSLYRYGGEEFIVVAENTEITDAIILAEELRSTLEIVKFNVATPITVSIGVAELKTNESYDKWIQRADVALYKAKNSGRNKVCSTAE